MMFSSKPTILSPSPFFVVMILIRRDVRRMFRQPARLAATFGTPVLVWVFMAAGFAEAFQPEEHRIENYTTYLLPGMMTLVVTFAAVFSSISVIEERTDGWLQAALVTPAPRWSIAMGKVLSAALVAWLQASVLLASCLFLDEGLSMSGFAGTLLMLAVTAIGVSALGLIFAWRSESTASFHAVMNLILMPMWLLSGAFFPIQSAAPVLGAIMIFNPLTWCSESIRSMLQQTPANWFLPAAVGFAIVCLLGAIWIVGRPSKRLA